MYEIIEIVISVIEIQKNKLRAPHGFVDKHSDNNTFSHVDNGKNVYL